MDYKQYLKNTGTIVQIGAYDGVAWENYGLRELMLLGNYDCHLVEPQEDAFEKLKISYGSANSNIEFHNYAIYTENGEMSFCKQNEYSSFVNNDPNGKIIKVKTKTLKTFFEENNIQEVTGLFLDVEGVEDVIFNQLFEDTTVRPEIIRYEYPHIKDQPGLEEYIRKNGYTVAQCVYYWCDKICIRNDLLS